MLKPSNPTVVTNGQHAKRKNNDNDNDNRHPSRLRLSRNGATAQQVATKNEYGDGAYKLSSYQSKEERRGKGALQKWGRRHDDEGGGNGANPAASYKEPKKFWRNRGRA